MSIKKAFQPLISLLEANSGRKVSSILDDAIAIASAKAGGGGGAAAFHKDADGNVVAVKDFYFGTWISPLLVEFGSKANSASGLSSMSKQGTNRWTKRNSAYKKARAAMLDQLLTEEITNDQAKDMMVDIEAAKTAIVPLMEFTEDEEGGKVETVSEYQGFDTLEKCLADLEERGLYTATNSA